MTEQLTLDLPLTTVHCFTCPHAIQAPTPDAAHQAMEDHYDMVHAVFLRALVAVA